MKNVIKFFFRPLIATAMLFSFITTTYADSDESDAGLRYYLGTTVDAGLDTGYSGQNVIKEDNPHFGWSLGKFFLSGYTSVINDSNGNLVFLKNVGDEITLWYNLEQDINKLNGRQELTITEDVNGHDQYFEVEKTNFLRGALIIRHTDYQNLSKKPVIYTDFLSAKAATNVNTEVEFLEEGDYEVALNYEIKEAENNIFGMEVYPTYKNYRVFFRFSVRNGNCMIYPRDVSTTSELNNTAITPNGFYLDMAKSRYLEVSVKKEVLKEGAEGLTEDTRFNRTAKDGEKFTEEGIYTITVRNKYTNLTDEKKIYVGTNDVLRAHITTGLPIAEIREKLALGATVDEYGELIIPQTQPPVETTTPAPETEQPETQTTPPETSAPATEEASSQVNTEAEPFNGWLLIIIIGVVIVGILAVVLLRTVKNGSEKTESEKGAAEAEVEDTDKEDEE